MTTMSIPMNDETNILHSKAAEVPTQADDLKAEHISKLKRDIPDDLGSNDAVFKFKSKIVVYDKRSLFIFKHTCLFRKFLVWVTESSWFDYAILLIILFNSVSLALYDYSDRDNETSKNQILSVFGQIFGVIFLLEAAMKIISMGLVMHKNSYMRDAWNVLDLTVALATIVDLVPNVPNLRALRTLRVFRPLKSINAVPSMRRLVSTLIISLPELGSVVVFLFFIFLLFGILGIYQFGGELYSF